MVPSLHERFHKAQEAFSEMNDKVQESISGARVIKAFGQEEQDVDAFKALSKDVVQKIFPWPRWMLYLIRRYLSLSAFLFSCGFLWLFPCFKRRAHDRTACLFYKLPWSLDLANAGIWLVV